MDRRSLLRRSAAAAGTALLGGLAGCSGGDDADGDAGGGFEDLTIDDFDAVEGDGGELVVTVTVANTAAEPRSGTLYVNVEANGTANTRVRHVELDAAGTKEFEVPFEVTLEEFNRAGSLDFDFEEA